MCNFCVGSLNYYNAVGSVNFSAEQAVTQSLLHGALIALLQTAKVFAC